MTQLLNKVNPQNTSLGGCGYPHLLLRETEVDGALELEAHLVYKVTFQAKQGRLYNETLPQNNNSNNNKKAKQKQTNRNPKTFPHHFTSVY